MIWWMDNFCCMALLRNDLAALGRAVIIYVVFCFFVSFKLNYIYIYSMTLAG